MATAKDTNKALQEALGKIEKQFGKGSVMRLDERAIETEVISTGALPLDIALGVGGLPKGRIVEIFGPESSGKTTFCYELMAQAQKSGGLAAFIDTEHSMDPVYAASIGVDTAELIVSQPDGAEEALEIADTLIRSGAFSVVVIDSVAALVPKAELEGEMGDAIVGLQARLMGQALRKLRGTVREHNTILVFTNQLRHKIGNTGYGPSETTPGGRALPFFSSVRLDIRRIETLKQGTDAYGNKVRFKVVKNKVAPPFKTAEVSIVYGEGYDRFGTLLDMGSTKEINLVSKAGAFYTFESTGEKAQGKVAAAEYLKEHPEVANEIEDKVRALYMPSPDGSPVEMVAPDAEPEDEDVPEEVEEAMAA